MAALAAGLDVGLMARTVSTPIGGDRLLTLQTGLSRSGSRLETVCCRSDLAGECRRAPIPDVGQFLWRLSAVPRRTKPLAR
jgi:hypothetical protein